MNNGELIDQLSKFPRDKGVTISDGFDHNFYTLDMIDPEAKTVTLFENKVDIAIGGCRE